MSHIVLGPHFTRSWQCHSQRPICHNGTSSPSTSPTPLNGRQSDHTMWTSSPTKRSPTSSGWTWARYMLHCLCPNHKKNTCEHHRLVDPSCIPFNQVIDHMSVVDKRDVKTALTATVHAMNNMCFSRSRTAYQAVFGRQPRLPDNVLEDETVLASPRRMRRQTTRPCAPRWLVVKPSSVWQT